MKYLFALFLALFIVTGCIAQNDSKTIISVSESKETAPRLPIVNSTEVKNVIFMIGDGTGLAQISSGQLHLVGKEGLLNIQRLPVIGLVKTYATDNLITDSASGATAYSCGMKTNNRMIAMLPDSTSCKTILEHAEEKGMSTGLVATSGITHATPASYAAHVSDRGMQTQIAEQFLSSGVEVFLGGGTEYFIPQTEEGSKREDNRNLIQEFYSNGYTYVETAETMKSAKGDKLLGMFAPGGLTHADHEPTLAEMTTKALDMLAVNDNGFFLMVEGSQIDWGGHGNDAAYVMREVQSFDEAVGVVLDFAVENGETLVVITADHETGGMTMQRGLNNDTEMEIAWTTGSHTGIPVPLMAYGPQSLQFSGWHENSEIGVMVALILGMEIK
jgi:alkaline phosphatase